MDPTISPPADPDQRIDKLEIELKELRGRIKKVDQGDRVCIVCFSGEWDKLFAAFTMATGSLALGMDVHLFFTFWGACALKNGDVPGRKRGLRGRIMDLMMPSSAERMPLSRNNFGGLGKRAIRNIMKRKGIDDLKELIEQSRELGAVFHCCDTSMEMLDIGKEDLLGGEDNDWCGVTSFLSLAMNSKMTLFI